MGRTEGNYIAIDQQRPVGLGRFLCPLVDAFLDLLDDLGAESVEIARMARGDKATIDHHFAIFKPCTGIDQICFDRLVPGDLSALHQIRLDQQPWRVANGRDRFAGVEKGFHEIDRLVFDPQYVGIHLSARQNQRVKIIFSGIVYGHVDGDAFAPVLFIPAFDRAGLQRHDGNIRTGVDQLFPGFEKLRFFKTVRRQDCYVCV